MVRANYNTPETVPLYKAALEIWRTLSAELDFNILFSTQGELDLVHTVDALEVERDKSLLNRAYGVTTDILTVDEVRKRCPLVDVTGGGELPVLGASFHPPGSIARHDSVVWGFASAAQRRGVQVHEGVAVTGVRRRATARAPACTTDAGPVSAGSRRERRGRLHAASWRRWPGSSSPSARIRCRRSSPSRTRTR